MRAAMREPLVHLAVLGALLFALHRIVRGAHDSADDDGARVDRARRDAHVIVLDDAFAEALVRDHAARTGKQPDDAGRRALVASFVREEALYREARAQGLEAGDVIVRRRLVQKMELLLEGTADVRAPTDDELSRWLRDHEDDYRVAPRVAFTHVLFARDRRRDRAEADARAALDGLRGAESVERANERAAAMGDPFLLGREIGARDRRAIAGSFGDRFAAAVIELPIGEWSGPIESSFGAHLVRVTAREPGRVPALSEVRAQVERAWMRARKEAAARDAIARVVASYRVERTGPSASADGAARDERE